jgi:hypothetical protein
MTKKTLVLGGIGAGIAGLSFAAGLAVAKAPTKESVLSLLSEATWTPLMKDSPLPAVAPIQGDGTKGAYLGYLKLPAGLTSPPHAHTSDYWAVLVQGRMTHWPATGSEAGAKQLGVGDLTFMPGKLEHVSKCFPGAECIAVIMQKGKADFLPGKAAAAAAAAKPAAEPAKPAAPK